MPDEDVVARYAGLVLQYRGTSVGDLFDARAHIEAPGARMLASRKSRRRIVARLKESVDEQGADLLNPIRAPAFHRLVVELTGNQTLMLFTSVVEQMAVATEIAYERQNPPPLRDARQSHTAHSDFIELVRIGDPAAAEAFWYDHIVTVGSKLQKLYGGSTRAVVDIVE
jgi:DNA-binding FadR family transcriptional regulator